MLILKRKRYAELNGRPEGTAQSQIQIEIPPSAVAQRITLVVLEDDRDGVKVGIQAPRHFAVDRAEVSRTGAPLWESGRAAAAEAHPAKPVTHPAPKPVA